MATIPNPPTFTVGQKLTAALMNTNVRDAVNFLTARPLTVLTASVTQTLTTSVYTPLNFDTEAIDSDNTHTAGSPTLITAVTPGWYTLSGTVGFAANGTNSRFASFFINNTTEIGRAEQAANAAAGRGTSIVISAYAFLNAGDTAAFGAWQNSGGSLATTVGATTSRFSAEWEHS